MQYGMHFLDQDKEAAPTTETDKRGYLWLSEFVRKSRIEVDEVASKISEVEQKMEEMGVK